MLGTTSTKPRTNNLGRLAVADKLPPSTMDTIGVPLPTVTVRCTDCHQTHTVLINPWKMTSELIATGCQCPWDFDIDDVCDRAVMIFITRTIENDTGYAIH